MNSPKNFKILGLAIIGLSLILLLFNFFNMYNLVGNCPNGSEGCASYSKWQFLNKTGLVLLITGIGVSVIGLIRKNHN